MPRRASRSANQAGPSWSISSNGPISSCSRGASPHRPRRCRRRSRAPASRRRPGSRSSPARRSARRGRDLEQGAQAAGLGGVDALEARLVGAVGAGREVDRLLDPCARPPGSGGRSRPCPCGRCSRSRSSARSAATRGRPRGTVAGGSAARRLAATFGIRSMPTRSSSPNTPVLGMPSGRPRTASASSTVRPSSIASVDRRLQPVGADPVGDEARACPWRRPRPCRGGGRRSG